MQREEQSRLLQDTVTQLAAQRLELQQAQLRLGQRAFEGETQAIVRDSDSQGAPREGAEEQHSHSDGAGSDVMGTIVTALRQAGIGKGGFRPKPGKPPIFSGDPHDLKDWEIQMEVHFARFSDMTELEKALMAGEALTSKAGKVFTQLLRTTPIPQLSWEKLRGVLRRRFTDVTEPEEAFRNLYRAAQGQRAVQAWEAHVRDIMAMEGMDWLRDSDRLQVLVFRMGLRPSIRTLLVKDHYSKLEDMVQAACEVEHSLDSMRDPRSRRLAAITKGTEDTEPYGDEDMDGEELVLAAMRQQPGGRDAGAYGQGGPGYSGGRDNGRRGQDQCPPDDKLDPGIDGKTRPRKCHFCHRWGHFKDKCPKNPLAQQGNEGTS